MHDEAFKDWRQECGAIEQEMDLLLRSPVPSSAEERQVRRIQFAALVERREDAARKLINADRARVHREWRRDASASGDYFIPAPQGPSISEGSTPFVKLPDGRPGAESHEDASNVIGAADQAAQPVSVGSSLESASEPVASTKSENMEADKSA